VQGSFLLTLIAINLRRTYLERFSAMKSDSSSKDPPSEKAVQARLSRLEKQIGGLIIARAHFTARWPDFAFNCVG
jgi:hypothetical protein